MSVLLPSECDLSKVSTGAVKTLEVGGKIADVKYDGGYWKVQAPAMVTPFGSDPGYKKTVDSPDRKWGFNMSFGDVTGNSNELTEFQSFLSDLDERILQLAEEKSEEWFGKRKSREVLEEVQNPLLRQAKKTAKDGSKQPPTVFFKIPPGKKSDDGAATGFRTTFFDASGEPVVDANPDELIQRGARLQVIFQPAFLWFVSGKFGLVLNADSVWVQESGGGGGGSRAFSFRGAGVAAAPAATNAVADDDEEAVGGGEAEEEDGGGEEEEEEAEAEPEPEPEVKPKRVVRRRPASKK